MLNWTISSNLIAFELFKHFFFIFKALNLQIFKYFWITITTLQQNNSLFKFI